MNGDLSLTQKLKIQFSYHKCFDYTYPSGLDHKCQKKIEYHLMKHIFKVFFLFGELCYYKL